MRKQKAHTTKPVNESFRGRVMSRLRSNRWAKVAFWNIVIMLFIAIFADFIANKKPLYAKYQGKAYYPVVQEYMASLGLYHWEGNMRFVDWKSLELEGAFWAPVRYDPADPDFDNTRGKSPFGKQNLKHWKDRHFLGTDELGRDVLSGLIHGTRISLTIGILAIGIASVIGVLLGLVAGYFGDDKLRITRAQAILLLPALFIGWFYAFRVRMYLLRDAITDGVMPLLLQVFISLVIFGVIVFVFMRACRLVRKHAWLGKRVALGVDLMLSRFIEFVITIPALVLLVTLASLVKHPDIYFTMGIIGVLGWTSIARLMRAEMLRTRNMEYIESARALGLSQWRIIFRHALPNSMGPVTVVMIFGIAGAILIESSLSYLGIGVSLQDVSWGSLLRKANETPSSWWLTLFPGFAIFITVTSFNLLGEGLRDAMDPKQVKRL